MMKSSVIMTLFWLIGCVILYAQPNPRHLEEISFDGGRKRLMVFGGIELHPNGFTEPNSVFEWDGKQWFQVDEYGPIGRRGHVFIYDPVSKHTILLGGVAKSNDSLLYDMWSWNGNHWQVLNEKVPVTTAEGVYDNLAKRILILGRDPKETSYQLWEFKKAWKLLSAEIQLTDIPANIAFDETRNTLVVVDWVDNRMITFLWSGGKWQSSVCEGDCPSQRTRYALMYSPKEKITYLYGGLTPDRSDQFDDFWQWDGSKWKKVPNAASPPKRNSAHFVETHEGLILYGGTVKEFKLSNEMWIWNNNKWNQVIYHVTK